MKLMQPIWSRKTTEYLSRAEMYEKYRKNYERYAKIYQAVQPLVG